MRKIWQLQEAKNSLSKVVDLALVEGPQTITRHGRPVAVILSKEDFDERRRSATRGSLLSFLQSLHFGRGSFDVTRAKDHDRELEL